MDSNIQNAYVELRQSFSVLPLEEKRKVIANKINEMAQVLNKIDPISDIPAENSNYTNEDEYLCHLHDAVYNLENKIGNIFKSISQ